MIICEIGLNHMGNIKYVNQYIDKIIHSNADGLIFHLREKPFYQHIPGSKFLLSDDFYYKISKKLKNKIKFGMAVVDPDKIDFCEKIGVDFYKIFADDIGNTELINRMKETKKKIFVSTGTAGLPEIKKFIKNIGDQKENFILVHTQLNYDPGLANLKAISSLKFFGLPVAYGNHASNLKVIFLSLAYEPSDILFYVKGDLVKKHVDDIHAVKLNELSSFIKDINLLTKSIGTGKKQKMKNQT
jgi:N,N'-diacetyllegionaminate synthase